jgi:hypothetical protein
VFAHADAVPVASKQPDQTTYKSVQYTLAKAGWSVRGRYGTIILWWLFMAFCRGRLILAGEF